MHRYVLMLLFLMSLAVGMAQHLEVQSPPDRFVAPGEFVTLVFRLEASTSTDVQLEAVVSTEWAVVRQPGVVALEAGRSTPVAVSVEVPPGAPAFTVASVGLSVDGADLPVGRVVELTVTERPALSLQAPADVTLTSDGLEVRVANDGNIPERATLELRRGTTVLAVRDLELAAGERAVLRFDLRDEGVHTLVLTGERAGEVRRAVNVVRFGAPEPAPLTLAGEVIGAVGTSGTWRGSLALRGPLSDVATLDARLDGSTPGRSFAQVDLEHGALRVGGGWRDPLRLAMPTGVGIAGSYHAGAGTFVATVGRASERLALGFGAAWTEGPIRVAGGLGWSDEAPWLAVRVGSVEGAAIDPRWSVAATYRRAALRLSADLQASTGETTTRIGFDAVDLLSDAAAVDAAVTVRDATGTAYANVRLPLSSSEGWNGRFGVTQRVMSALPGDVGVALQAGTRESFGQIAYQSAAGDQWRSRNAIGVRLDEVGVGITVESGVSHVGRDTFNADARFIYYPEDGSVGGRVSARYQLDRDALSLNLGGAWDLSEATTSARAAIAWSEGPWSIDVSSGVAYASDQAGPWSASITFTTRYAFEVMVPEPVVRVAGGRDLGTVQGQVRANGEAFPGVEIVLGSYRVRSDDEGAFRLEIPPGTYRVVVDAATVPIAYQLVDGARTAVEVRRGETAELTIRAVRTTVLRGRVVEDRDGDGRADEPPVGVPARVSVVDVQGLRRIVGTDAEGAFELRGLLPGEITVRLVEVPAGATISGPEELRLRLVEGVPGDVTFLVRPAVVQVRTFTPQALRVRSVVLETDRVPPGAAPLLRVEVQGQADAVEAVTADGIRHPLQREADVWLGRVPVPFEQPAGVFDVAVEARVADAEATRRGQLIVDPGAPVLLLTSDGPVRAGAALTVRLSAFVEVRDAALSHPFGDDVTLTEDDPGRWVGLIAVPAGTSDAVYELAARVETADGRTLVETLRFRVLDP